MKRKTKKVVRRRTRTKKNNIWKIFSMFVFTFLVLISLATYQLVIRYSHGVLKIASNGPRNSLQLETFYPTPTPTTVPTSPPPVSTICDSSSIGYGTLIKKTDNGGTCCYYHAYADDCSICCSGACTDKDSARRKAVNPNTPPPDGALYWCDAKPVIYLYPTRPTLVSVKVDVPGNITKSIPLYPPESWKNVLAGPDGTFMYQGKKYSELFYEASITPVEPPKDGIIVPTSQLNTALSTITSQLGLISREQKEFLEYWVPKLQSLDSKYVLISVFTPSQKEIIDKVTINPKPNTFIEFIMYYKPLNEVVDVKPLKILSAPKRVGFTAVEWGGIIDK